MKTKFFLITFFFIHTIYSQTSPTEIADAIIKEGLTNQEAYTMLQELTSIGHRLSGSTQYAQAVEWAKKKMEQQKIDKVWLESVTVPHWVRGEEKANIIIEDKKLDIAICALGGSIGTSEKGITAEVIEVHSLEEAKALGEKAKGKIIFYNRPFDKTKVSPFEAYSGAVDQRYSGAVEAARVGAVAAIVRSMTNAIDNEPHTGMMAYNDSIPKIPTAAISTIAANQLSELIQKKKNPKIHLTLACKTLPDVESYNVIGEIIGSEKPEEIILVGGHLDSWDKGTGAHDDGAGVVQSMEVLNLLKKLGLKPKRTIRAVLFANEENGLRGAKVYAAKERSNEKHIAAIESDAGGFAPRGFGVADTTKVEKIKQWSYLLEKIGAEKIRRGGGGADISTLRSKGTVLIGLNPEPQRYFDYHHTNHDTIDKVHPRELELGAIAMTILSYMIAEEGIE